MSMKTYENITRACVFAPLAEQGEWGLTFNLIGPPGIAKTSIARRLGRMYNATLFILNPWVQGEGFFGSVPSIVNGYLDFPKPFWMQQFYEQGRGIVFVDEANHPGLLGAIQAIVLDKTVGSGKLPGGVRCGMAMNPANQSTNGCELTLPTANRLVNLELLPPTNEEHREYMLSLQAGVRPEVTPLDMAKEEERVLELWPSAFAQAVGLETSFLQSFPNYKNKDLTKPDPSNARGWYSDRSCEAVTRFIASASIQNLAADELEMGLAGIVGKEWTEAFITFRENVDMPNITDLLDKKVGFKHNPKRLDRSVAVLNGATALLSDQKQSRWKDRVANMWDLMAGMQDSKDILVEPVIALSRMGTHLMPEAKPLVNTMGAVFKNLNAK